MTYTPTAARSGIPPLVCLGLLVLALLSYFQFPGHAYLDSDTQIYVPMFERLRDPALLERDPMVTRPHMAFTLYDELTLAWSRLTGLDFQVVLGLLHVLVRLSLLAGIFLLTRAMGLSDSLALACAGIYALGGRVLGPSVLLVEYEPVPRAFALGPAVLAAGLAAQGSFRAAGVAGATGFLLHATTVAPFWALYCLLLFVPDRPEEMKRRLWGLVPLAAAAVVLKLAAAGQPGVSERQAMLSIIDEAWEKLIRLRASYVYVSLWPAISYWQYGVMAAASLGAYCRLRRFLQPPARFFLAGLPALGILSLPASYLLLEKLKWAMLPQWQPLRGILFLQLFTLLAALVMAFELACKEKRFLAAGFWAALGLAAGHEPRLLFFLAPAALGWLSRSWPRWVGLGITLATAAAQPFGLELWRGSLRSALLVSLVLAALLVAAATLSVRRPAAGASAITAVTAAAFFLVPGGIRFHWSGQKPNPELAVLCQWARAETNVNAVFLFADSGRALEPGVFRARAARALYVDWKSGGQINFFPGFARLWWSRWQQTMEGPFQSHRLAGWREAGIDYLVLSTKNRLADRKPVFENEKFLAYAMSEPQPSAR